MPAGIRSMAIGAANRRFPARTSARTDTGEAAAALRPGLADDQRPLHPGRPRGRRPGSRTCTAPAAASRVTFERPPGCATAPSLSIPWPSIATACGLPDPLGFFMRDRDPPRRGVQALLREPQPAAGSALTRSVVAALPPAVRAPDPGDARRRQRRHGAIARPVSRHPPIWLPGARLYAARRRGFDASGATPQATSTGVPTSTRS